MPTVPALLRLLPAILGDLDGPLSLERIADRSRWSRLHFHRAFRRVIRETPKQYVLRLRLEDAAARLASGDEPVFRVAMAAGFTNHEVFTRAFRRRFGRTPSAYRAALQPESTEARGRHRELTRTVGPCVGLFRLSMNPPLRSSTMPTLSIARQDLAARPGPLRSHARRAP